MLMVAGGVVAAFLVFMLRLTPGGMHETLAAYPGFAKLDSPYYLFHRLMTMDPPSDDRIEIAIIGGSTTRESIWDDETFAARVEQTVGQPVTVVELSLGGSNLVLSWALVEQTVCKGFDYAILGVNVGRFARSGETGDPARVLGLQSPRVAAFLHTDRALGGSSWYFLANHNFVLRSLYLVGQNVLYDLTGGSRFPLRDRSALQRHVYVGTDRLPDSAVMKQLKDVSRKYVAGYQERSAAKMKVLDRIARTVKECGGELILLETPIHPWLLEKPEFEAYREARNAHHAAIEAFAVRYGLALIDPNDTIKYTPDDTNDHGHLRLEETVRKTTNVIAEAVGRHIINERKASGGISFNDS